MNMHEEMTLGNLVDDQRNCGIIDRNIAIIVYDFAFNNFNPADKSSIDALLRKKGISPFHDGDPSLPARP